MTVLVLAAHPDDEVLGAGGTISKLTKSGEIVKIVIMATGITSRRSSDYKNYPNYTMDKTTKEMAERQVEDLHKQAKKAANIMGVKDIEFFDFPDNEMDSVSTLQVTKQVEKVISQLKPSVIYTHSPTDLNIDHKIVYNATITATRPIKTTVKEILSFEVPSSTEWNFGERFVPNVFVDISKELSKKLRAMSQYKNELRKYPHPRSIEGLEVVSKKWGTVCGCKAAEAFSLVRQIRD